MTVNDNFVKGHWVKHFPKSLQEATLNLSSTQELMVYRTFLYNGLYGKAIPQELQERIFIRLEEIQQNIQFLLKTKALSEDEGGGLFLPFALEEFQVANNQIKRRKEAGRRGGLKSSRNKISSILPAKSNKDKDKDKDKDNKIISDTKVSSSFSQAKSDMPDPDIDVLESDEEASAESAELVEPELIEQEAGDIQPPRKPITRSQDKAVVEVVAERWNQMAKGCQIPGIRLPVTAARQKLLLKSIRELELTLDQVLQIIDILPDSDFLSGKNSTGWKIDFSWFIKTENLNKIIDGKYHNEKSTSAGAATRLVEEYLKGKNQENS